MISKRKVEQFVSILGVLFLFSAMNPFLMWIIWPVLINVPLLILVLGTTLFIGKHGMLSFTYTKLIITFPILLFMFHIGTPYTGNPEWDIGKLITFSCLICFVFFREELHFKIFLYFRKFLLIFCWFSLAVFVITFIGVDLPYFKIPGFTLVMQNSFGGEAFYKLYGLVVSSTNTIYNFGPFVIARVCGPVQEPGHFAIYLGLLMIFEKLMFSKISRIVIIVGALTFSPNFFLFYVISLLYDLRKKMVPKYLIYFLVTLIFAIVFLSFSNEFTDQIVFLFVDRNLMGDNANFLDLIDNRAGKIALHYYREFTKTSQVWYGIGVDAMAEYGVLSDFRGMIFKFGIIGLIFSVLSSITILFQTNNTIYRFFVVLIFIIIFFQRSWMFESVYIYIFIFIGLSSLGYFSRIKYNRGEI